MLAWTGKACACDNNNNSHASNIVPETVLFVVSYKPPRSKDAGGTGEGAAKRRRRKKQIGLLYCCLGWRRHGMWPSSYVQSAQVDSFAVLWPLECSILDLDRGS